VGVVLEVEPLEGDGLAGSLEGDGEELRVDLDQVHDRRRVHLAHGPVQREHAEGLLAGDQRRHEACVPGREIQDVVERVPVAVAVIRLEECARPPRLQRLAQGGKLVQREHVLADPVVGERAARGADHQPALLEHEHRRQIVRRDPRQPVQPAAKHVVHRLLRAHQRGELLQVAGEVHRAQGDCGCHGAHPNAGNTEEPVISAPLSTVDIPEYRWRWVARHRTNRGFACALASRAASKRGWWARPGTSSHPNTKDNEGARHRC
jgi:hypothetical protein